MPPLETPIIDKSFKAKDFNLIGVDGQQYSLEKVVDQNGVVIAFICNHCPYVQSIAHKIAKESEELAKIGVGFVGINSNDVDAYPDDSYENMKLFAQQHNFNFPYLFDETQEVARAYEAVCTPDFFGFDKNMTLQYRGRLDSSGKNNLPDAKRELFEAMQSAANGVDIDGIKQYPSIGCSIKWKAL
jgi:peroxiredoxin